MNPINKKDNKCFQYPVTVALIYEVIGKHPGKKQINRNGKE